MLSPGSLALSWFQLSESLTLSGLLPSIYEPLHCGSCRLLGLRLVQGSALLLFTPCAPGPVLALAHAAHWVLDPGRALCRNQHFTTLSVSRYPMCGLKNHPNRPHPNLQSSESLGPSSFEFSLQLPPACLHTWPDWVPCLSHQKFFPLCSSGGGPSQARYAGKLEGQTAPPLAQDQTAPLALVLGFKYTGLHG